MSARPPDLVTATAAQPEVACVRPSIVSFVYSKRAAKARSLVSRYGRSIVLCRHYGCRLYHSWTYPGRSRTHDSRLTSVDSRPRSAESSRAARHRRANPRPHMPHNLQLYGMCVRKNARSSFRWPFRCEKKSISPIKQRLAFTQRRPASVPSDRWRRRNCQSAPPCTMGTQASRPTRPCALCR